MKNSTLKIFIKISTRLLCLVLFLISVNSHSLLLIDYQIRKAAYEEACENKLIPELKCHGKCQMTKNMTQSFEQESTTIPFLAIEINSKVQPKAPSVSTLKIDFLSLHHSEIKNSSDSLKFTLINHNKPAPIILEINTPPPKYS